MRFVTICVGVGAYKLERAPKRRDTKGVRYLLAAHALRGTAAPMFSSV
jgi:hypothetical protein